MPRSRPYITSIGGVIYGPDNKPLPESDYRLISLCDCGLGCLFCEELQWVRKDEPLPEIITIDIKWTIDF